MNDIELLRDFSRHGAQEAFSRVVKRHLPVVYGVASRQLRSPDLANEVAQTVFLELARTSPRLRPDTCLVSWLYVATRRKAVDVIRREASRTKRETASAVMNQTDASPPWTELEPLLDEAMESLSAEDRRAVLLRYFENQSLTQVGGALKCSEDAAQKRVTRALERLRDFLARRGVKTVSSALAADLAAFAAPPVPTGLLTSIAGSLPAVVTSGAGQTLLLALQKPLAVAASGVVLWFASYEGWALHRQRAERRDLQSVIVRWDSDVLAARTDRDRLRESIAKSASSAATGGLVSADSEFDGRIRAVLIRIAEVKQRFLQNPAIAIPELSLLSDSDWFGVVQEQSAWSTEEDWRKSLAQVRTRAKNRATSPLQAALRQYLDEKSGVLPTEVSQLAPYLRTPMDPAIYSRYEMAASGSAATLGRDETVITERKSGILDERYDNLAVIGLKFVGVRAANPYPGAPNGAELQVAIEAALKAYRAAHDGKTPSQTEAEALLPFFTDQDKAATFRQRMTLRMSNPTFSEPNAVGLAMNLYHAANNGRTAPTPKDLAPYFQNPADGERYLAASASSAGR